MNIKAIAAVATLRTALIAGAAGAQTINPNVAGMHQHYRGERASQQNIARVRREVERSIDQLQRDNHDFGGHRVQAIELLQQARSQLLIAEQYDKQHPGQ